MSVLSSIDTSAVSDSRAGVAAVGGASFLVYAAIHAWQWVYRSLGGIGERSSDGFAIDAADYGGFIDADGRFQSFASGDDDDSDPAERFQSWEDFHEFEQMEAEFERERSG